MNLLNASQTSPIVTRNQTIVVNSLMCPCSTIPRIYSEVWLPKAILRPYRKSFSGQHCAIKKIMSSIATPLGITFLPPLYEDMSDRTTGCLTALVSPMIAKRWIEFRHIEKLNSSQQFATVIKRYRHRRFHRSIVTDIIITSRLVWECNGDSNWGKISSSRPLNSSASTQSSDFVGTPLMNLWCCTIQLLQLSTRLTSQVIQKL